MDAQTFNQDRSGNIGIIFALCALSVLSVAGLAVDFQRTLSVKTHIQAALDAASLSGAKAVQLANNSDTQIIADAQNMFAADIRLANAVLECPKADIVIDRKAGRVSADVSCALPTIFGGLLSVKKMNIRARSVSAVEVSNLDLAMMLDVSGSMAGQKIEDLKTAAQDAIDILIKPYTEDRVRIAFNTYATAVNVGSYAEKVKGSDYDAKSPLKNCVTERDGIAKFDDDAPETGKTMSEIAVSTDGKPMSCPDSSLEPLSSDATTLKSRIGSLKADGWTSGHLGIAWAWYLISPDWDKIWPKASAPHGYGDADTIKAVILMTDGEFNTYYQTGQGNSVKQSEKLCANMKKEGVIVYSVAFQAPKSGKKILQTCASSPDHFYDAKNGAELKAAYAEIASKLTNLRITK